jgi:hypothetical protein
MVGIALMALGNKTGQVCGREKKVRSLSTVDILSELGIRDILVLIRMDPDPQIRTSD